MVGMVSLQWGEAALQLRRDRAVWWPARKTLVLADPHFGKPATFRQAGVPIPHGVTATDLQRMAALVRETRAERLALLGDFFHAKAGCTAETLEPMDRWRRRHAELAILLVRGNHDLQAGDPPACWNIRCVADPFDDGVLMLRHVPPIRAARRWGLAGHLHPGYRLRDGDGSTLRLPCFHATRRTLILPAFGSFTGLHCARPAFGDRVFVAMTDSVREVPTRRGDTARRPAKSWVPRGAWDEEGGG